MYKTVKRQIKLLARGKSYLKDKGDAEITAIGQIPILMNTLMKKPMSTQHLH
jgi:hypothetical protein